MKIYSKGRKYAEYVAVSCYYIRGTKERRKGANPIGRAENYKTAKHIKTHLC